MKFTPFVRVLSIATSITAMALLTACAPKIGGNDYSIRGVGEVSQSFLGTVIAARPITVQGKPTEQQGQLGTGAILGAGTGVVAGSLIGRGATPWIAGTLGALAGGAAGHMIENQATSQQGMEYTIRLDQGGEIVVSQGLEPMLSAGQKVRVITSAKDRSRVVPA